MAWAARTVDESWWTEAEFAGRPMRQILAERDIGTVMRFLKMKGWSRSAISGATQLTETQVRLYSANKRRAETYEVLERFCTGVGIPRHLMGLGYAAPASVDARPEPHTSDCPCGARRPRPTV